MSRDRSQPELEDLRRLVSDLGRSHRTTVPEHHGPGRLAMNRALWSDLADLGLTSITRSGTTAGGGWAESAVLVSALAESAAAVPVMEHDLLASWLLAQGSSAGGTGGGGPDRGGSTVTRTFALLGPDGSAAGVPWASEVDEIVVAWPAPGGGWRMAAPAAQDVEIDPAVNYAGEPRDTVLVPVADIGGERLEDALVAEVRRRAALARALQLVGSMRRAQELVLEHVGGRQQFGRRLDQFQAIQHQVTAMASELVLADAACVAAVERADDEGLSGVAGLVAVAAAKSCAGAASEVVERSAHQCLGAMGVTLEHELPRHTTRMMAWRNEDGSTDTWNRALAAALQEAGSRGLWPLVTGVSDEQTEPRKRR